VQPAESVTQFALISTIMPHANREVADRYRWALMLSAALILLFTLTGFIAGAVVSAAFFIPITYLVYIYDVNLWEDAPAPVVGALFLFTGVLSLFISLVFFRWIFDAELLTLSRGAAGRSGVTSISVSGLLIFCVLLPVVAEIAKNIGPVLLARSPKFDDMIDGLTFGVASGTAYAAFETLIAYGGVFTSGELRVTDGLGTWLVVILNLMVVKSLIYGTATGIAVAVFSGLGEGYDGATPRYWANLAFAMLANIAYWLGVRLLGYTPFGHGRALPWGLVILAILVVRLRVLLHAALLEAAVEDAARGHRSKSAVTEGGFCPNCEMPLLPDAMFCVVCGESVRATSHQARRSLRAPEEGA
jgi:RsiW-degrading membrane proteinase PrsW (M82 family)